MANEYNRPIASSRKEAIEQGLSRYYGAPCLHGHGFVRAAYGCHCVECHRLLQEKRKEGYGERRRQLERERYAANLEKSRAKARNKYEKDSEKIRERRRQYHYNAYLDEEVRKKAQERTRKWAAENPEKARRNAKVSKHRRRALEKNVEGTFTAEDISAIYKAQKGKCAYFSCCRTKLGKKYHADHIVSLSRGGTNDRCNLQLTCGPCNLEKAAKDPIDYARMLGKLI